VIASFIDLFLFVFPRSFSQTVLDLLRGLIKDCNKYMSGQPLSSVTEVPSNVSATAGFVPGLGFIGAVAGPATIAAAKEAAATEKWQPVPYLLRSTADYITSVLRTFGLVDAIPSIGFSVESAVAGAEEGGAANKEEILTPYLDVLAAFRVQVRDAARAKDPIKVLQACDALRDQILPPLGVVFEDAAPASASADGGAAAPAGPVWKLRDPAELKREAEEKQRKAEEKEREKAERAAAAAKKEADKLAAASVKPSEMFKLPHLADADKKYSAYDAEGIPTHDHEGKELGEKAIKKLKKDQEKQKKDHEWYLSKVGGGAAAAGAGAGAAGAE
jgi:cysteinyl-tRNA synthetase